LPFDGTEDVLVGVVNKSGATVFGIQLSGNGIFDFDGDGAGGGGSYKGPNTSFNIQNGNSGVVNFNLGLPDGMFIWFSLEGAPSQANLAATVTIDPGHGLQCPTTGTLQKVGATGVTDFPPSNPPAGFLHEDNLTVAMALQLQLQLKASGYTVVLTKSDVQTCVPIQQRGKTANNAKSNILVSVHVNKLCSAMNFQGRVLAQRYRSSIRPQDKRVL
jgi:hypothetical protein